MSKSEKLSMPNSRGFGLIDFIIIGAVISILAFVVISNIVAHSY